MIYRRHASRLRVLLTVEGRQDYGCDPRPARDRAIQAGHGQRPRRRHPVRRRTCCQRSAVTVVVNAEKAVSPDVGPRSLGSLGPTQVNAALAAWF